MTIDADVIAMIDQDAAAAGLNRSQHVEEVLRRDHWSRYWRRVAEQRQSLSAEQQAELVAHERLASNYARDHQA